MRRTHIVKQIQEAVHSAEPSATIILPDSDIDVLIMLDGEKRDIEKVTHISNILYDIELANGVIISPMILLKKQWDNRPFKTPFYVNVKNEGIRL